MKIIQYLRKPYGIVTGCVLMSGVVVGTLEDTRHWVTSKILMLLPTPAAQVSCVNDYLWDRKAKNTGQYLVVLTQLSNDSDLSQTNLMDRSLRRQYGEDIDSAIQLESVDCTLFTNKGNAAERVRAAANLASDLTEKTDADVVIWGEVVSSGQTINIRLSHASGTDSKDYSVTEGVIGTGFGTDIAAIFATKVLTAGSVSEEREGTYLIPRMQRVLKLTSPLVARIPTGISADDLGSLWQAHGDANLRLSIQSGDSTKMIEAVAAYRAALEERTRERVPLGWAETQNNLCIALQTLWERGSGESRMVWLEEAVAACRAALEERTRERVPLDWAATQSNLGNALFRLGEHEGGTVLLEEALAALRVALEEQTRERVPLDWAATQNNLGNVLFRLGESEDGAVRLEEAVAAYRAALEERTRERVPLGWAETQNNLGNALVRLAGREDSTVRLEEAVAAYRAALEERTRERVSLDWAETQNNLCIALQRLGLREDRTVRFEEAVTACRAALEERTQERVPLGWAETQSNLGTALVRLGTSEDGTVRLEEAVAAYRAALEERTREHEPLGWATTFGNGVGTRSVQNPALSSNEP